MPDIILRIDCFIHRLVR